MFAFGDDAAMWYSISEINCRISYSLSSAFICSELRLLPGCCRLTQSNCQQFSIIHCIWCLEFDVVAFNPLIHSAASHELHFIRRILHSIKQWRQRDANRIKWNEWRNPIWDHQIRDQQLPSTHVSPAALEAFIDWNGFCIPHIPKRFHLSCLRTLAALFSITIYSQSPTSSEPLNHFINSFLGVSSTLRNFIHHENFPRRRQSGWLTTNYFDSMEELPVSHMVSSTIIHNNAV